MQIAERIAECRTVGVTNAKELLLWLVVSAQMRSQAGRTHRRTLLGRMREQVTLRPEKMFDARCARGRQTYFIM